MREFATLGKRKAVLGMIHLQPLPGTLFYKDSSFNQTLDNAIQSARALYDGGADGFEQVLDLVEAQCRRLIAELRQSPKEPSA